MTPLEALQAAVEKAGGSPSNLAAKIGGKIVRQNVEHWLKSGRVPAEHAPAIFRATGVACEALCPHVDWDAVRLDKARAAA